jgi:hypothetical protein
LVGRGWSEHKPKPIFKRDLADLDLHAGGRRRNLHLAVDDLQSALSEFIR